MVVLLIRLGKLRHRVRSASPDGLIESTTCKLSRQRATKAVHMLSRDGGSFCRSTYSLTLAYNGYFSSYEKSAGTMPEANMLLISYRKPSYLT